MIINNYWNQLFAIHTGPGQANSIRLLRRLIRYWLWEDSIKEWIYQLLPVTDKNLLRCQVEIS